MLYRELFQPYSELAEDLEPVVDTLGDGSHDLLHVARVWHWCKRIQSALGGDCLILFAACFLHDCHHVEKNAPGRQHASRLSALKARSALRDRNWTEDHIASVEHAIITHSFTGGMQPKTLEAKILRDADRLDSVGAIGIARCFYVAGRIGASFYDALDPLAQFRAMDETSFVLDHFRSRIVPSEKRFETEIASQLSYPRGLLSNAYYDGFLQEIEPTVFVWKQGEHPNGVRRK